MKSKLSVVVLTKNCERELGQALPSLSFCDEIIVIDDHSTDDTIVIAKSHDAIVYQKELDDNFALQRNYGLRKATGEWVLYVDSDEVVSKELAREIEETISKETEHKTYEGFYIKRRDIQFGKLLKFGETGSTRLLRLGRKESGVWDRAVHEVWQIKGALGELQNPLLHYPHATVAEFISEINRYSTINARVLLREGKHSSFVMIILYPLGKFLHNYFWKLGILDGTAGFMVAICMSFHSFLTRARMYLIEETDGISRI